MNLFFTSSIILSFVSFLMGLLVYLKDRKNGLNKAWFAFSTFLAGWSIVLYFVTSADTEHTALVWQYVLDIEALAIPIAYFYFIAAFLHHKISRRFSSMLGVIAIFLAFFSTTSLFKLGVVKKFTFFWIDPGPYYFIFPVLFLSLIFYTLTLLLLAYIRARGDTHRQSEIKYQLIGGILGFSGGVISFLPQLFNVFPFGSQVLLAYISLMSYLILKYRLFNVKLIIVEIALIVLNFLLFSNVFLSKGFGAMVLNIVLCVGFVILSLLLIRGIYKDIRDRERIQSLANDMVAANKRLFALEQQKTEFVSIASHQLRTPMTVIKGYASMVLEGAFGALPEKAREAMIHLYEASDKIVSLIEDLLTVSRIEQGRGMPIFETINFVAYIRSLMPSFSTHAREAGLIMSFNASEGSLAARVPLDKKKFEQAVKHLIDNAITYTKSPGSIVVTVSLDTTQHKVYLSISDTGIGMTDVQIKKLLGKNTPEVNSREGSLGFSVKERQKELLPPEESEIKKKSSGIGFYIAQEIINAHYGNIQIQSDGPNKGTTVIVELPELGQ